MTLQCVHCPGRTDHGTADCPTFRADLYADSAQARAGTEQRNSLAKALPFDWKLAREIREMEAANMKARVRTACNVLEMKLGMAGRAHP